MAPSFHPNGRWELNCVINDSGKAFTSTFFQDVSAGFNSSGRTEKDTFGSYEPAN